MSSNATLSTKGPRHAAGENMHSPSTVPGGPDRKAIPPEFQPRHDDEEVMNALVVED